jgi:hypothetical protein
MEKFYLAAGGARQKLAQPHQFGISLFVEPAAAHDELFTEAPDVSYRPPKQVTPERPGELQEANPSAGL